MHKSAEAALYLQGLQGAGNTCAVYKGALGMQHGGLPHGPQHLVR